MRSLESILENTLDLMSSEDAKSFLTRKLAEYQLSNVKLSTVDSHSHNVAPVNTTPLE